jgi:hypothetical protein
MALTTYTHGGTSNQPFGTYTGVKVIDNFATSSFPTTGSTDPYTSVQLYLVYQFKMYMGGTSGTANAARQGLWNSATSVYHYANQTINGVAATVSSATVLETVTLNAVIQSGKTYYGGGWASASLASKRDTATGSFSMYSGNATSGTNVFTYNPGNLYFQVLYYYLPSAPGTPTITSTTASSATISWTAPADNGGTAVTGYKVQYSTDAANWNTFTEGSYSTTPATTATVTGLKPGTTYYFRVAAKNAVIPGYGDATYGNGTGAVANTTGTFTSGYSSYSDSSGAWFYDSYSSGPFSAASTSVKLPGGVYSAGTWQPIKDVRCQVFSGSTSVSTTYSTGNPLISATLNSPGIALKSGDTIIISGASASWVNGTWTVNTVTSNTAFTFNGGTPTTTGGSTGTLTSATRSGSVKVWNGTSWVSYF